MFAPFTTADARTHPAGLPAGRGPHVIVALGEKIPEESLERLERLDDTIFAALSGDAAALDAAPGALREAQQSVEPPLLDDSRREYLRQAEVVWRRYERRPQERLATGFAALEILGLLSE